MSRPTGPRGATEVAYGYVGKHCWKSFCCGAGSTAGCCRGQAMEPAREFLCRGVVRLHPPAPPCPDPEWSYRSPFGIHGAPGGGLVAESPEGMRR